MTAAQYVQTAKCYLCLGATAGEAIKLAKLVSIALALDPNMATTPSALMEEGKCFACLGLTPAQTMELVLLNHIETTITTGGGIGCFLCGEGDPVNPPGTCTCAGYINLLNSQFWYWDNRVGQQRWYQFG